MQSRALGDSGLSVSALAFGAMQLGAPQVSETEAATMLNGALDLGIRLIDSARRYGLSEERIGRHLAGRRGEFLLSTKVGYDVPGHADWTHDCVVAGVDAARARLRTDVIDIVHLHSCPENVLRERGVLEALADCVSRGKVRLAAYSGDGAPLDYALDSGLVRSLQASVNLCDQAALATAQRAASRGVGLLAKRAFLGHPWRSAAPPTDPPHRAYWERFQLLRRQIGEHDWPDLALRFAVHSSGISACIVGGTSLANLAQNVRTVERGAPGDDELAALRAVFAANAADWHGII